MRKKSLFKSPMFVIQDNNRYVDSYRDLKNILIKIFILCQINTIWREREREREREKELSIILIKCINMQHIDCIVLRGCNTAFLCHC